MNEQRGKKPDPGPHPRHRRCERRADGAGWPRSTPASNGLYNQAATLPRDACLELFIDRLKHYQVAVHLCSRGEIAATIAGMTAARGKSRLIVPADIDPAWLSSGAGFVRDEGLGYRDLDVSEAC